MNPAAVLVWLPGLLFLLVSRRMRPYRSLGLAFAVLLLWILTSGLRRGDRIAGVYPVVLAAGATFWDQWAQHPWQRRARLALPALLVGMGVLVLPASLPVLPPEQVAAYFEAIDESPEIEPHDVGHAIPLHLLGRLEWQRVAAEAVAAWATLSPDERARAVVLAPHWVVASVVEYYGRHHDLPPVVSPHNAYFLWRHEADGRDLALAVGIPRETLAESFGATREVGHFRCEHCASWRPDMPIFVATQPTRPIPLLLEQGRTYGN